MYHLDTFYTSKEWIALTKILKLKRVDDSGCVICAHCGKPITKAYDAICHHTIFLTEENVNDARISLNPELIQIVHHKCHNHIHNKLGYKAQEVFLVYGCPLSGKTSYVQGVCEIGDLIVDIDSIWAAVNGGISYAKPKSLNSVVFGIRDYLLDSVKVRRGRWNNAYLIGGYPLISERERLCKSLGARSVYIECSKAEALRRLDVVEDGRDKDLWSGYIDEWFQRFTPD